MVYPCSSTTAHRLMRACRVPHAACRMPRAACRVPLPPDRETADRAMRRSMEFIVATASGNTLEEVYWGFHWIADPSGETAGRQEVLRTWLCDGLSDAPEWLLPMVLARFGIPSPARPD